MFDPVPNGVIRRVGKDNHELLGTTYRTGFRDKRWPAPETFHITQRTAYKSSFCKIMPPVANAPAYESTHRV